MDYPYVVGTTVVRGDLNEETDKHCYFRARLVRDRGDVLVVAYDCEADMCRVIEFVSKLSTRTRVKLSGGNGYWVALSAIEPRNKHARRQYAELQACGTAAKLERMADAE